MDKSFCTGCDFVKGQLPECTVTKITTGITFEELLENEYSPNTRYPICHKNSQKLVNNKLVISDECDSCQLCYVACPKTVKNLTDSISINDDEILKDINLTNIVVKYILGIPVASEIKAKGNARQKRLDLVLKLNENVYIIKILRSVVRTGFYYRSYEDSISTYIKSFPNLNFNILFLTTDDIYRKFESKADFKFCTLHNIKEKVMEV